MTALAGTLLGAAPTIATDWSPSCATTLLRSASSEPPPEGRILGADALTSGMSLDDCNRYIVTKTYEQCGRNQNETARRLKINWRTVARWVDHGLLELWAVRRGG